MHGETKVRHRAIESPKLLNGMDQNVPAELEVHFFLDNVSVRRSVQLRAQKASRDRLIGDSCPVYVYARMIC